MLAILATLAGIGIPLTTSALDEMRVGMAARYVAGRIVGARLDALQRSTALGLRFDAGEVDYSFAICVDGNGNGLRTAEIASGTDQQITPAEFLGQRFADVQFGLVGRRTRPGRGIGKPRMATGCVLDRRGFSRWDQTARPLRAHSTSAAEAWAVRRFASSEPRRRVRPSRTQTRSEGRWIAR